MPVRRHGRTSRRLLENESGLAAAEFGLVAIPFFMLLMGLIEVGIFLVVNRSLSNATAVTARQVRVGAVVATGKSRTTTSGTALSPADFKAAICANVAIMARSTCAANIQIDVRTATNFTSGAIVAPQSGKSFSNNSFCYYSGVPGQIVAMRAFYLWRLVTPLLWPTLTSIDTSIIDGATTSGHWVLASSTNVFVNEPNGNTINTGAGC